MTPLADSAGHLIVVTGTIYQHMKQRFQKLAQYLRHIAQQNRKGLHLRDHNELDDPEYLACVDDILKNEEFLKTKLFKHHRETIYDHAIKVSYLAYKISRRWKWNYREAARAGLLHDFFLYHWRDNKDPTRETKHFHGFRHPRVAWNNSRRHFKLNALEEDIILKHMFPLTPFPPKYRESLLVLILDKYVAVHEILTPPERSADTRS